MTAQGFSHSSCLSTSPQLGLIFLHRLSLYIEGFNVEVRGYCCHFFFLDSNLSFPILDSQLVFEIYRGVLLYSTFHLWCLYLHRKPFTPSIHIHSSHVFFIHYSIKALVIPILLFFFLSNRMINVKTQHI